MQTDQSKAVVTVDEFCSSPVSKGRVIFPESIIGHVDVNFDMYSGYFNVSAAPDYLFYWFFSRALVIAGESYGGHYIPAWVNAFGTYCTTVRTILSHLHCMYCTLYTQYMFPVSLFPILKLHLKHLFTLLFTHF